jgi:hypothetical protein
MSFEGGFSQLSFMAWWVVMDLHCFSLVCRFWTDGHLVRTAARLGSIVEFSAKAAGKLVYSAIRTLAG